MTERLYQKKGKRDSKSENSGLHSQSVTAKQKPQMVMDQLPMFLSNAYVGHQEKATGTEELWQAEEAAHCIPGLQVWVCDPSGHGAVMVRQVTVTVRQWSSLRTCQRKVQFWRWIKPDTWKRLTAL